MRLAIEGVNHYKCDWCKADHTQEQREHISLEIASGGVASLASYLPGWRMRHTLRPGRYNFCGGKCAGQFMEVLVTGNLPEQYRG
jgi:hypothetical protein